MRITTVMAAALLAVALLAQTSEPRHAEGSVGPNIASQAVVLLTSVTNPLGISSHDLNVMRDGFSGPSAFQYDTWDGNNAAVGEDYYGYAWVTPQQIARVMFTEGSVFPDGGFFTTLRLETSPDGVTWTTIAGGNDASPPYPNANDGIPFSTYQWDFIPAITARYLRVIGIAGGTAEFTSVSEFQVFTSGGVVPVDNIAPYADFVGTNAAAPTGNGASDLNVLRDGIKPPVGSFNPALQYDTNTGAPNPAEVYFLYRWPSQRTITRIELYGGQETAAGGWWTGLRIELSSNGNDWNVMKTAADAVPVYPNAASQSFNHYTFAFATPRSGKYMRIIGPAGGSPGYISASEIEVYAELEPGEGGYYPNIAPSAAEIFGSHNAGVSQGSPTLTVINDGYAPGVDAVEPPAQFDTWNGFNAATGPDFYAYRFATTKIFTAAAYTEGMQFTDGGWFAGGPQIEVSNDGATWTLVPSTIAPVYVDDDGHNFNRYAFTFTAPVTGQYIRLVGVAGGESEFTSVAEFEVYGGDLTATNSVDLRLAKSVSNATPNVGDTVTFTVTLSSHNGTTATGVTVADALPAGVTLVSATPTTGTYAAGVWSVPTLLGNSTATLALVVTVNTGTETQTITNTASISSANQVNTGTPTTASASITVGGTLGAPNVVLTVTVDNPSPSVGTNITITITAKNIGTAGATGVSVPWTLPPGLILVSTTPSTGSPWSVGSLAVNEEKTLVIVATVTGNPGPPPIIVTAGPVTCSQACGTGPVVQVPITVTAPNVVITVTVDNPTPPVGTNITITITATNIGTAGATGVSVPWTLPSGLILVSTTPSTGSPWAVGSLAVNEEKTLVIVATVTGNPGPSPIIVTAGPVTCSQACGTGPVVEVPITVTAPNVVLTVTVDNPSPSVGTNVTITITAKNIGTAGVTGVSVPWTLPPGLILVSTTPSTGSPWAVGSLAVNEEKTLVIVATVTGNPGPPPIIVTAGPVTCSQACGTGPVVEVPITVTAPNVVLTVTVDNPTPPVGTNITITITAKNIGTAGATGVSVPWTLPPGLILVSTTPSTGSPWAVGSLAVNEEKTLVIVATVTGNPGPPPIVVTAGPVTCSQACGTGPVVEVPITVTAPNVVLTVTVDNPTPPVGTNITITITATNVGTAGATGVSVPWTLPPGLTLVSTTPFSGTPWSVGSLAVAEVKTLVIVATVNGTPGQPLVVNAGPVTCDQPCGTGTGSVTITPAGPLGDPNIAPLANLLITSIPAPLGGGNHDIEIIRDLSYPVPGTNDAGAQYDTWDAAAPTPAIEYFGYRWPNRYHFTGAKFVDGMHFGDGGYFSAAPGIEVSEDGVTWTAVVTVAGYQGNAAPNFTAYPVDFVADGRYLRLAGTPGGSAEFTSIAEFEVYGTLLPASPNVNVTVVAVPNTPTEGGTVTITVTATNTGDGDATGIVIDSPIPAGLTLVSATPSQGGYSGGTWTLGGLPAGASQTLVLILTVDPGTGGQTITPTATITLMTEPNPGDGSDSASMTVQAPLGDPNIAPLANLLITSVPAPLGGGNHDLDIIRDLSYPVPGTNNPALQYDTFDFFAPTGPDYFGYRWPNRYHFTGAKFVDGMHFGDGGYFSAPPTVEISDDGISWTAVATVTGYQGNAAPNFTAYSIPFVADGRYLRIIGTPAGAAEFTSIAELEVYGTVLPGAPIINITVTVDNPAPLVGQNVTITITATNVGTAGATGVSIPWVLPSGLTLVSTTPSSGSPWAAGSLAVGEVKTLVVVATVTGAPGQPLVVNVGPLTMDQPNAGTGSGSVTITPAANASCDDDDDHGDGRGSHRHAHSDDDDDDDCDDEGQDRGWMNVGGNIGSGSWKYTWGGAISCDGIAKKSFEYQDHRNDVQFKLRTVTSVTCLTTPGVSQGQPRAGFNTLVLTGTSSDGKRVEATFIDAGEPGRNDSVNIRVFRADDEQISSFNGTLGGGNLQAHKGSSDED